MAGHNKWSKIKHIKAKEDAKKGKAFTRIAREITIAAKAGGGDPTFNAQLRNLLDKARAANMPNENAARAIKKGTGELPGASYEAITYEGYGPLGIAVIIETLTDNRNRTVAELRFIFSKHHGQLGDTNTVAWMFNRMAVIHCTTILAEDILLEILLDYDIYDIKQDGTQWVIIGNSKSLDEIKQVLIKAHCTVDHAEIEWIAQNGVELDDQATEKVVSLLSELDDHEDVQNVYSSMI
jgi:YebC/PmpR family DNA-binding regulatory protein